MRRQAFEALAEEPSRAGPGLDVKPLRGVKATWRLRVGDYRGIYEVEPGKVRFTRFGHRSNVYEV
ncbi:MAG TPA: type II toxin-antitoxin system RelE/ParE family toxin [Thermoplasmata archaeon]|nr:type II toxin-antitoxin system RelE/ParE family toxin [Thermoplasmata archaeon]